jgi:hypothetical protein
VIGSKYQRNDEYLRQQYARDNKEASESTANDGVPYHYLKQGRTIVRILPIYTSQGAWYREIEEHFLQGDGHTCPRPFGQRCPACELGEDLYKSSDKNDLERANQLRPRRGFYMNAIILSAEGSDVSAANGVQVLKTGVKLKRQLLHYDSDVQGGWGDITSLEQGFNVTIIRKGKGMIDTEYNASPIPQRTNVAQDLANLGIDINTLVSYDLEQIRPPKSFEELQSLLDADQAANAKFTPQVAVPTTGSTVGVPAVQPLTPPPTQAPIPMAPTPGTVPLTGTTDPNHIVVQPSTTIPVVPPIPAPPNFKPDSE